MTLLSIDISGEWSPRQAARVLEIVNQESHRKFHAVDVTSHHHEHPRVVIAPVVTGFQFENNVMIRNNITRTNAASFSLGGASPRPKKIDLVALAIGFSLGFVFFALGTLFERWL